MLPTSGLFSQPGRRETALYDGPLSVSGYARATSPPLCGGEEPRLFKVATSAVGVSSLP
ncbi:hypothetical protein MPLA_1650079 [Mesorhizobium sp. ORS 3359]|nr:hypothetical protein MPLA_1650079 [Mesorhizobium sp. ORS 3359]